MAGNILLYICIIFNFDWSVRMNKPTCPAKFGKFWAIEIRKENEWKLYWVNPTTLRLFNSEDEAWTTIKSNYAIFENCHPIEIILDKYKDSPCTCPASKAVEEIGNYLDTMEKEVWICDRRDWEEDIKYLKSFILKHMQPPESEE